MYKKLKNSGFTFALFFTYLLSCFLIITIAHPHHIFEEVQFGREKLVLEFMRISFPLAKQLVSFTLLIIVLYLILFLLLYKNTHIARTLFKLSPILTYCYFIFITLASWLNILYLNQALYPLSNYTLLIPKLSLSNQTIIIISTLTLFFTLFGIFLYQLFKTLPFIITPRNMKIAALAVFTVSVFISTGKSNIIASPFTSDKPDIIIIGLDSVAPSHIKSNPDRFKYLNSLLNSGKNFTNTITPIGRTFPAWTSILSGQYPVNNGIRFNLTPLDQINREKNLLPKILKTHHYQTIYAQDERKFNNLDESFGFDSVIGPKVGAAEFILTKMSDIPLLNLALFLPFSDKLFPSIAHNRADYIHYSPNTFIKNVLAKIPQRKDKPLFLATHLCLAHHPYTWRNKGFKKAIDIGDKHKIAIDELENQIKTLMSGLQAKGRLENAIVVILSDHGESLGYKNGLWLKANKGDRIYEAPLPLKLESDFSGHGTNVTDKTQYMTLLSFISYGNKSPHIKPEKNDTITSLVDVMPSLLFSAGIQTPPNLDGQNILNDNLTNDNARFVISETGITFNSLSSIKHFDEKKLLDEAKEFYTIEADTAKMILKPELIQSLINKKDYAIHSQNWMLVFNRKAKDSVNSRVVALINKKTGEWTLGENQKLINQAPLEILVQKAYEFMGDEIADFKAVWPFKLHYSSNTAHYPDYPLQ